MAIRIIITWQELQKLGWPYSRVDTWRKMKAGKFPQCVKLYGDRNSHPVWRYDQILAFLKERGLYAEHTVKIDIE
jgi:predicted DNA-binding transcriptional regulator AlpA